MPIIRIQMAEGRSTAEKTALMKSVTDAVRQAIGVELSTIHVMIQEIPANDIMIAGEPLSDKKARDRV